MAASGTRAVPAGGAARPVVVRGEGPGITEQGTVHERGVVAAAIQPLLNAPTEPSTTAVPSPTTIDAMTVGRVVTDHAGQRGADAGVPTR